MAANRQRGLMINRQSGSPWWAAGCGQSEDCLGGRISGEFKWGSERIAGPRSRFYNAVSGFISARADYCGSGAGPDWLCACKQVQPAHSRGKGGRASEERKINNETSNIFHQHDRVVHVL